MNKKKSLLFVVSQLSTGGAERVVATLASYFASIGHPVFLVVFRKVENTYPIDNNVKIYHLKEKENKILKLLERIIYIRKFIKEHNIDDYITFENFYGITCSFGNRVNYITSMRNDPRNDRVSILERMARYLNFRYAKYVVFQTEEIKKYFGESIQKHGIVIQNPIKSDLPEYHGSRKKEVVAVCRLEPQKNIPMMLNAFLTFSGEHKLYQLKIYGDGSLKSNIEKLICSMGLQDKVQLMGFQSNIAEQIKMAAIYVCSSDYEGLSNSMLEAMAIGIPVVTTDSSGGGAREVIENGVNGFLVPVNDYVSMASCMGLIADHEDIAQKISMKAVEIRTRLSEEEVCRQWDMIL